MRINFRKFSIFNFILIILSIRLSGQSYKIDYYGIVSTEIDSNMAKMTSDLYYTQLTEISNFEIEDKRSGVFMTEEPDKNLFSTSNLSFFTTIQKDSSTDKWVTVYHVVNNEKNFEHTQTKEYDSFYKILMESKNILKDAIKNLIESENNDPKTDIAQSASQNNNADKTPKTVLTTENLSGTWTGEDNINKIVILRGGRGFIIFKNGASMNVSVTFSEDSSKVIITQSGKANASFYPELPRNTALNAAISAEPIKWVLDYLNTDTLVGIKNTLLPDGDSYKFGNIDVEWRKVN